MGPLGESLLAWLWLPALMYAVSLGVGLLVARLLRLELPSALVPPFGFCIAIVLVMPGYRLGAGAWLGAPLLVAAAAAGFTLSRRTWRQSLNPGWILAAAVLAYGLYLAPVVLSGGWTWTGYNFVNDTAIQLQLSDHLADHGLEKPIESLQTEEELESTSTSDAAVFYYLRASYPVGAHGLLAALSPLALAPTAALYMPFIAGMIALSAMALATLASRLVGRRLAAVAGFAAVASNLTYAYALQGNVKEIAALAALCTAAAMGSELLRTDRPAAMAAALALCLTALLAVFGGAGVPFAGALAGAVLVAVLLQRSAPVRASLRRALLAGGATLAAACLVAATEVIRSVQVLNEVFAADPREESSAPATQAAAVSDLGQLARPLEPSQVAGIWLGDDYRIPVPDGRTAVNAVLIGVMIAMAIAGVVWLVRRRADGPLLLLGGALVTLFVVGPRVSPYAEGKLLAITAPAVVLMAMIGVAALGSRRRSVAVVVGGALLGAILLSNAYAYHAVKLAPTDRMKALEEVRDRYEGRGFLLLAENEEYGKYFLSGAADIVAFDSISPRQAQLLSPQAPAGRHFDLDEHRLGFIESFPWVVLRRSPSASRPPANFRLDWQNRYYSVWRRAGSPEVAEHLPLQQPSQPALVPSCPEVRALARRARRGERLVAAERLPTAFLDPSNARRSSGWLTHPTILQTVVTATPGQASGSVRVDGGSYRVWVQGSFGRNVDALVDGDEVGSAKGVEAPGQWHELGTVRLRAGRHDLALRRGSGGLAPGDGYRGELGPLALEPLVPVGLVAVKPERYRRLCGRTLDWIERVRP